MKPTVLSFIKKGTASRLREVFLPLYFIPHGMIQPALSLQHKDVDPAGPIGGGPEESQKDAQMAGAPLL